MRYLFRVNSTVLHKASGRLYAIIETPRANRLLEYCREPYYVYTEVGVDTIVWVRRQSEMEDGRFVSKSLHQYLQETA